MSASRERKKRMAQEQQAPVQQTTKKKKKLSEGWILAICIVLILAIVFGSIAIYRGYWANATVVTVGEHEITTGEFSIFYNMQLSSISSYASYLGISTTTGLDEQVIPENSVGMLGLFGYDTSIVTADTTWAQLFAHNAMKTVAAYYGVYEDALANGFTLSDEAVAEIDQIMASVELNAVMYGVDLETYLEGNYGKDCSVETYRHYVEVTQYYSHYATEVRDGYTKDTLDARYNENTEEFDAVAFYLYTATAEDFMAEDAAQDAEVTEAEIEKAKVAAEAMAAEFNEEDEKVTFAVDAVRETIATNTTEEAADWIFDEAAEGDIKLFEKTVTDEETKEETTTWYVLKLAAKGDYDTVNVMSIFVADAEAEEGEEAAEGENAQTIRDALAEDGSKEGFTSLLSYSDEDTTEYTNATRYQFAGYDEVYAWLFNETRTEGEWREFQVDGGVYFVYFIGYGETYLDNTLRNTVVNEWLEEIITAAQDSCVYDEKAAMHAFVGIYG